MESLQLADGRSLEFCRTGPVDPSGWLIFHVGTPSAAALFPHVTSAAEARGIGTTSYSRAGYGGSTRSEGRTVAQEAVNTAALADHLGASTFFVAGWSGGGPGALACAALLSERVRSCVVFAGDSPVEEVGAEWYQWFPEDDRAELRGPRDRIRGRVPAGVRGSRGEVRHLDVAGSPDSARRPCGGSRHARAVARTRGCPRRFDPPWCRRRRRLDGRRGGVGPPVGVPHARHQRAGDDPPRRARPAVSCRAWSMARASRPRSEGPDPPRTRTHVHHRAVRRGAGRATDDHSLSHIHPERRSRIDPVLKTHARIAATEDAVGAR